MSSNLGLRWSGWEAATDDMLTNQHKQEVDTVYDNFSSATLYEHADIVCEHLYLPSSNELTNLEEKLDMLMAMLENSDSVSSQDSCDANYTQVENFINKYSNK